MKNHENKNVDPRVRALEEYIETTHLRSRASMCSSFRKVMEKIEEELKDIKVNFNEQTYEKVDTRAKKLSLRIENFGDARVRTESARNSVERQGINSGSSRFEEWINRNDASKFSVEAHSLFKGMREDENFQEICS